jgi:hypothetical protein
MEKEDINRKLALKFDVRDRKDRSGRKDRPRRGDRKDHKDRRYRKYAQDSVSNKILKEEIRSNYRKNIIKYYLEMEKVISKFIGTNYIIHSKYFRYADIKRETSVYIR